MNTNRVTCPRIILGMNAFTKALIADMVFAQY